MADYRHASHHAERDAGDIQHALARCRLWDDGHASNVTDAHEYAGRMKVQDSAQKAEQGFFDDRVKSDRDEHWEHQYQAAVHLQNGDGARHSLALAARLTAVIPGKRKLGIRCEVSMLGGGMVNNMKRHCGERRPAVHWGAI